MSASAYTYKNTYDTYRIYCDLAPASGLQNYVIGVLYPRHGIVNLSEHNIGNLPGTVSRNGSAGDANVYGRFMFNATENVANGGTM